MNPIIKNILAVIAGCILGSIVNMGIIMISSSIIPPPAGANLTTVEGLKASMHLMEPKHFIFPFLAHALGALIGAMVAIWIAATNKALMGYIVCALFLIGGIINVVMLPSPLWFTLLDVLGAYIPMGFIASKLLHKQ